MHENTGLSVAVLSNCQCYVTDFNVIQWQWRLVVLVARGVYRVRLTDNCYLRSGLCGIVGPCSALVMGV